MKLKTEMDYQNNKIIEFGLRPQENASYEEDGVKYWYDKYDGNIYAIEFTEGFKEVEVPTNINDVRGVRNEQTQQG